MNKKVTSLFIATTMIFTTAAVPAFADTAAVTTATTEVTLATGETTTHVTYVPVTATSADATTSYVPATATSADATVAAAADDAVAISLEDEIMPINAEDDIMLISTEDGTLSQSLLDDIEGTDYETAVEALVSAGIVSGYPDGTFRPLTTITRAEACTMICKALGAGTARGDVNFSDIEMTDWEAPYVSFCESRGIVNGYPDGTFRPDALVTNAEFITMLLRAWGDADSSLSYPDGYITAAKAAGITSGMVGEDIFDAATAATRGNCAILLCNAAGITTATPSEPADSGKKDDSASTTLTDNGILENYTGYAYGFVTDQATGLDADGDAVPEITFYMGDREYDLLVDSSDKVSVTTALDSIDEKSALVRIKLSGGAVTEVTKITDTTEKTGSTDKVLLTELYDGQTCFYKVNDSGDTYANVTVIGKTGEGYIGINEPCVVYTCEPDGDSVKYELGSTSDIEEGSYIAAYSIDKDSSTLADVIVVVSADDASKLLGTVGAGDNPTFK